MFGSRYQPYHPPALNRVEQLSLVTAVLTLLIPSFVALTEIDHKYREVTYGFLLVFNFFMVLYLCVKIFRARLFGHAWLRGGDAVHPSPEPAQSVENLERGAFDDGQGQQAAESASVQICTTLGAESVVRSQEPALPSLREPGCGDGDAASELECKTQHQLQHELKVCQLELEALRSTVSASPRGDGGQQRSEETKGGEKLQRHIMERLPDSRKCKARRSVGGGDWRLCITSSLYRSRQEAGARSTATAGGRCRRRPTAPRTLGGVRRTG